jgi:hypothetical protein
MKTAIQEYSVCFFYEYCMIYSYKFSVILDISTFSSVLFFLINQLIKWSRDFIHWFMPLVFPFKIHLFLVSWLLPYFHGWGKFSFFLVSKFKLTRYCFKIFCYCYPLNSNHCFWWILRILMSLCLCYLNENFLSRFLL